MQKKTALIHPQTYNCVEPASQKVFLNDMRYITLSHRLTYPAVFPLLTSANAASDVAMVSN